MTVNELINHYRRGSYTSSKILENQCVDFGIFLLAESSSFMYAWEPPLEQLLAWKDSAMKVLRQWDEVFNALGSPGPLGASKAKSALDEIEHRNHLEKIRVEAMQGKGKTN